jgi:hypothetical protein
VLTFFARATGFLRTPSISNKTGRFLLEGVNLGLQTFFLTLLSCYGRSGQNTSDHDNDKGTDSSSEKMNPS